MDKRIKAIKHYERIEKRNTINRPDDNFACGKNVLNKY